MSGWVCLFLLIKFWKNRLELARITLWASNCLPSSQARVTSAKSLSSLRIPNALVAFSLKSFHCKQSFSDIVKPTGGTDKGIPVPNQESAKLIAKLLPIKVRKLIFHLFGESLWCRQPPWHMCFWPLNWATFCRELLFSSGKVILVSSRITEFSISVRKVIFAETRIVTNDN